MCERGYSDSLLASASTPLADMKTHRDYIHVWYLQMDPIKDFKITDTMHGIFGHKIDFKKPLAATQTP